MADRRRGAARRRGTRYLMLVVLGAVVVAVLAGVRMFRIVDRLDQARLAIVRSELAARNGDLDGAERELAVAERRIVAANADAHNAPDLLAISWVPVVNRNVEALRSSVRVAFTMVNGGRRILEAARPLAGPNGQVQVPLRTGEIPLEVIRRTEREVSDLTVVLPGETERPSSTFVVPPLARVQDRIFREAARRKAQFESVSAGLQLLVDMSGGNGPRRYLLAVANAAEMRGTGGMILSYGVLSARDGRFTLDRVGPIDELRLEQPAVLTRPPAYLTRYAELQPSLLWRNTNITADFPEVGPVLEAMYERATGERADGVVQIDSHGLAAILAGIGPVDVGELGAVTANNAVALTLNEAYVRFPDRTARREYLGDVAEATFRKLVSGDYPSLRPLATALIRTSEARHIQLHSRHAAAQRAAVQLGLDGALPAPDTDFAQLTVQNFGGNKLDYYLDTQLSISGRRPPGRPGTVTATVDVVNTSPPSSNPPYIFGPLLPTLQPAEYRGLVSVYLPRGTQLVAHRGGPLMGSPTSGDESGRTVIAFGLSLRAGERRTIELDLQLPSGGAETVWQFVPAPRVRPTVALIDLGVGSARVRGRAELDRSYTLAAGD